MSIVAERIGLLRNLHGWSQGALAEHVSAAGYPLTQPRVSKIERGDVEVDDHLLHTLSLVADVPVSWFAIDAAPIDGTLRFRRLKSKVTKTAARQVSAAFTEAYRIFGDLATRVGLAPPELPLASTSSSMANDELELYAYKVREAMHLQLDEPVSHVTRVCERARIIVVPLVGPAGQALDLPGHQGASGWRTPWDNPLIGYFPTSAGDRHRFTVAHELGHLVLHTQRQVPEAVAEDEANRFAGAFLIPRDSALMALRAGPVTLDRLAYIKAGWGIAIQALIMRARNLGLIDAARQRSLHVQVSNRGWRTNEPVKVGMEQPLLARKLLETRFKSIAEASEVLKVSVPHLLASVPQA